MELPSEKFIEDLELDEDLELEEDEPLSSHASTNNPRGSLHLIPTLPDLEKLSKRYTPIWMRLVTVITIPTTLLGLGIAMEIALRISLKQGGFVVPRENVFSFVSVQFLLSFFPTVIVIAISLSYRYLDWHIRYLSPYVLLSNGPVKADESMMIDYIGLGTVMGLAYAFYYTHRVVFWSIFTGLLSFVLDPLAGSIFQIRQMGQSTDGTATSIRAIGLAPTMAELDPFIAAAGFTAASSFFNLTDPPFIKGGWAIAEVAFPNQAHLNGSVAVNTTGIQTMLTCDNGVNTSIIEFQPNNLMIVSTSPQSCPVTVNCDASLSGEQYGVRDAYCHDPPGLELEFRSVMFWYFLGGKNGQPPQVQTVFCSSTLKALSVEATADLTTGDLLTVDIHGEFEGDNNVTKGDLAGKAFNGLLFTSPSEPSIQARAMTVKSTIPSTVYRFAAASGPGLEGTFDSPNGFLNITTTIYTQYLAVAAKAIYFVPTSVDLPARVTTLGPRLWLDPLPSHALGVILILVGSSGICIQLFHRRQRGEDFIFTEQPMTIGAIAAKSTRSGFEDLLLPYDDEKTMERKLKDYVFKIDNRTGAIVADHKPDDDTRTGMLSRRGRKEGVMTSLLGDLQPSATANSSHTALAAAAGLKPWKQHAVRTAYDP